MTWRDLGSERPLHTITESLGAVSRRLGMTPAEQVVQIFGRWEELVGPAVAAHSKPLSITDGRLLVGVDDPAWATTLKMFASKLLENVNSANPARPVKEVAVVVRRSPGAGRRFQGRRRPPEGQ